ncbi:MAG: indolepyruvate ferredoxin oxidoreductase subunit alpha [Tractidigestivibacter sp.]|jgi:indolepyruvate ferredoxin oxidoreductase alpha subunit|uniref:indolepyruvate ferredoxin oxidoreductase subunit alpha n=1 Tax=Tractidigestivibacter sp. TaxID=2847320 RepID=UPI003D92A3EE
MQKRFLMGNQAIGLGALAAGVNVVAGYPGTPSTEIIETIAAEHPKDVHVEWSVNEKAAMEVAAGAAYAGARSLVTMKCVGLNVAADPLMSLEYVGVKGGMVIVVADDPGPISSQTEQDTRTFARFSKVPVFDPCSVEEAYQMVGEAFELSERLNSPVFLRATTRIDHGYEAVEVAEPSERARHVPEGFVRDPKRWVIFPALSVRSHAAIEQRNARLSDELSDYPRNQVVEPASGAKPRLGIASHGINWQYALENVRPDDDVRLMRVATPFPFPERLALQFLEGLDEVLCVEELDPVIERALLEVCGRNHLDVRIRGKLTGDVKPSGENSVAYVGEVVSKFLGRKDVDASSVAPAADDAPQLPVRPPVLCAGCPHRASFYAVKAAMRGKKCVFCGDIGCYTLGNAAPLDMCDTCLCMGAGITVAQGLWHVEPDTHAFAFVGDSTFFASGITGVVNAFYNQADLTVCVLDNSTTAMTGHQPHPGTGRLATGEKVTPVSIERVLRAIGLACVETVDPLDHAAAVEAVRRVEAQPGVKAIIFKSPCVFLEHPRREQAHVDAEVCIGCKRCVRELGCPALVPQPDGKVAIDSSQCTGCTLCEQICPTHAISGGER